MDNEKIPKELWLRLEEMRSSMAIEGFELSDAQLIQIGRSYLRDPLPEKIKALKEKAKRDGRPLAEVVNEELGLGLEFPEE